ncbi:hypothetical protein D3C76_959250 [compost metagenome]
MINNLTLEELPQILTAQHIADHMHIARITVYELFNIPPERGGISNFRVGKSRRVTKDEYIKWINRQQQQQTNILQQRLTRIEGRKSVI